MMYSGNSLQWTQSVQNFYSSKKVVRFIQHPSQRDFALTSKNKQHKNSDFHSDFYGITCGVKIATASKDETVIMRKTINSWSLLLKNKIKLK